MEAAGTLDTGELRVHEGRVAALRVWACDGTVADGAHEHGLRRLEPATCWSGPMVSGWLVKLPAVYRGVPSGR